MRALAFTDIETTGLDPNRHEIIELAVIRVAPRTLGVVDELSLRVRPGRLADADLKALELNGYTPAEWADSVTLADALAVAAPLLEGAALAGHNVSFDRAFLDAAWRSTGVDRPEMDHHVVDTASLAWPLLAAGLIDSVSLGSVCEHLGIEGDRLHRALPDARRSLDVARRMLARARIAAVIEALACHEPTSVARLTGRVIEVEVA